jgi:hypothetical protein
VIVDEEVTMTVSARSFGAIWHIVWDERGGGPLHFLLEHVLLQWPGGFAGLRLPSIAFAVLALPAVALLARELAGDAVAVVTTLLVAASPLLTSYASFGRPHVLLTAWLAWGAWVALRAARGGGRPWWLAAGIVLASSLFVHPIAPLYALALLAAALAYADERPRALVRDAWLGVAAFAAIFLPYYVHSLHVLRDRYGVGSGARGRTYSGNSVLHDALVTLTPATTHVVNTYFVLAVAGLAVLLARRRWHEAAVIVIVVAAPIVFFSWVPSTGRSGIFFTRYMLPALPFFLVLVAVACVAATRRLPWPVLAVVTVVLVGLEVEPDLHRISLVRGIHLADVASGVRSEAGPDAILFGSTGTIGKFGDISTLSYGRPPVLLDRYVIMRVDIRRVDDDSCVPARAFLASDRAVHRGLFLFYAARDDELAAGKRALPGAREIAKDTLLVAARGDARELLMRGLALRRAWKLAVPRDYKVDYLIRADTTALAGTHCEPLGQYGNPDITPARSVPPP